MQHQEGFRTSIEEDPVPESDAVLRVRRIHRADLFFDHWQKSASARVAEAFRSILREERPDIVHVNHWIRLSRDLVACAAWEGIPAVVTLHDHWTSCLVTFRVRPDTKEFCEVPLAPSPCLACAAQVPPRTPWITPEDQATALVERRTELVRELSLARAVISPSATHAKHVARFLGMDGLAAGDCLQVVPHGRDLEQRKRSPRSKADGQPLVLGSWGHLHPLKGADLLLAALQRLPDPRRVRLHLAGGEVDPGYAARLHTEAEGLDVVFHGPFVEADLPAHPVTHVDAMVSGTRALESYGLILDEACALGLPMLLPRSGAFPERLQEPAGVLFYEPRDPDSIAKLMTRLLEDPELLERVRSQLPPLEALCTTTAQHAERLHAIYESAAAQGPPDVSHEDETLTEQRLQAENEWGESLARHSARELGFEEGGA
jgi:glycosyltransferase involved in cell wall biosynthesis